MKFELEQLVELNRIIKENKDLSDGKFEKLFDAIEGLKNEVRRIDEKKLDPPNVAVNVDLSEITAILQQLLEKEVQPPNVSVDLSKTNSLLEKIVEKQEKMEVEVKIV